MKFKLAVMMKSDKPLLVGGKHIRPIEWRIMQTCDSYVEADTAGAMLYLADDNIQSYHIIQDDG